jgi:hypothetical protein
MLDLKRTDNRRRKKRAGYSERMLERKRRRNVSKMHMPLKNYYYRKCLRMQEQQREAQLEESR